MNSKVLLAVLAAVLVGGGILAVRNLTSTADTSRRTSEKRTERESDSNNSSVSSRTDDDEDTRITRRDRNTASRRQGSARKFTRGEGAAALEVTPATTSTEQAATIPVVTPETTATEEAREQSREIADLVNMFRSKTDPEDRIDIADELGLIDSPESIQRVLELLREEQDPAVKTALLEAMQGLEALEVSSPDVYKAVAEIYSQTDDPDVRIAAQDLLGDIATADAAAALRDVNVAAQDPYEKLNARENLMRIWAAEPELVPQDEVQKIMGQLQQDYQQGPDAAFRSQALMGLAVNGRENVEFFQQALQTEQDQQVRQLLERLVRMYSGASPGATAPGAATPAPSPGATQLF